jgi:hypothetical protein
LVNGLVDGYDGEDEEKVPYKEKGHNPSVRSPVCVHQGGTVTCPILSGSSSSIGSAHAMALLLLPRVSVKRRGVAVATVTTEW